MFHQQVNLFPKNRRQSKWFVRSVHFVRISIFSLCVIGFFIILWEKPVWAQLSALSPNWPAILHDGDRILFIGNGKVGSEGGLQNHFRRTLEKADPPLHIQTEWPSMYNRPTLEDMYTEEVVKRIRQEEDDLVIVTSGSPEAMSRFDSLIERHNGRMVVFATWADNPIIDEAGWQGFRERTMSLTAMAEDFEKKTGVPVVPGGLIYYDLLVDPLDFKGLRKDYLFVPGSSVQNDLGTLVNVSAIYAVTTGRSPVGLYFWNPFPEKLVREIQERVWRIVRQWKTGKTVVRELPQVGNGEKVPGPVMASDKPAWESLLHDGDRIFYVGNSYIGTEGGLENHFQRMLSMINPPIRVEQSSMIFWGQGLSRMYTGKVLEEIRTGNNDLVVVTSGPSGMLEKFHETIDSAGSKMMIHMTWGRNPVINEQGFEGYREETSRIVDEMKEFENRTGVPVAPCGLVFYDLTVDPPDIPGMRPDWVYMVENIHQNHIGTMINAATHYAVLTGRSPVGLPMWDPYPPELVEIVQQRAWRIVQDWKEGRIKIKPVPEENNHN